MYEKSFEGTLNQLLEVVKDGIRGELVLIIHGQSENNVEKPDNLTELLEWYRNQPDMTLKEAVRSIAVDLNLPRNMVYQQALAVWKTDK